jgi:hypothetical protein
VSMVSRKFGAIIVAAALTLGVVGTAVAETVPQAVYTPQGEVRPQTVVQQSLVSHGVKDVAADHWAAGSISVLLDAGLIAPDANGNLAPDTAIPFDTGVAVFAKALGIASKTDSPEVAAQKAVSAGLITSKTGTLSRLDVALLLFKALGLKAKEGVTVENAGFTDAASIPAEYLGIVAALKEAGVFRGFPDGTFQPNGQLTTAQLAVLVDRILGAHAN